MRRRLAPKPEQPPEGMIFNPAEWIWPGRKFIYAWEFKQTCEGAMRNFDDDARNNPALVRSMGVSKLHHFAMLAWNYDPSYSWRRRGTRPR